MLRGASRYRSRTIRIGDQSSGREMPIWHDARGTGAAGRRADRMIASSSSVSNPYPRYGARLTGTSRAHARDSPIGKAQATLQRPNFNFGTYDFGRLASSIAQWIAYVEPIPPAFFRGRLQHD